MGLEGQVLAWLAAYSLGQEQVPRTWVLSGLVTSVGSQTAREIDDVGALTAAGGHLLVQSKKGLKLGKSESSPLAKASRQVVAQYLRGVPEDSGGKLRPIDPDRDRLLIVTDASAPAAVRNGLASAVDQLATLPAELPFTDVQGDQDVLTARDVMLEHLRTELRVQQRGDSVESTLRGLLAALRVRVLYLDEGGRDHDTARQLLRRVLADGSQVPAAWQGLQSICQSLAQDRTYWVSRDGLVGRLEHEGIMLGPDPGHVADVRVLRARSQERVAALRSDAQIFASDGVVRLTRAVEPLIADFEGNLALVGSAGAGKTAVALQVAHTLDGSSEDLLFLTGDTLAGTAVAARAELGIHADLADVLLAWRGSGRATLIIDGLDITRLSEPSRWLLDLVHRLSLSRWRVLATVRTYSLRYGPNWQEAFRGSPIDPSRKDPTLSKVRHLVVDDLTDEEMNPLLNASPRLAGLFASGSPALIQLLRNPFNLKIANDLISKYTDLSLDSIRTRHDLLTAYWDRRVNGASDRYERHRALTVLTDQMIATRRPRVANPPAVLEAALLSAARGLLGDDVLREDPKDSWAAAAPVGYSHPVLFDYAVARLVLGQPGQPLHLLDKLAADPDLAVIARPSLDFHLAAIWHSDPGRQTFWSLAIRLDADERGHALASLAAAATCLHEGLSSGDLDLLIEACERRGPMAAQANEARRLLAQIAGVMPTREIPAVQRQGAVPVVAAAAYRLAASAEAAADINLARLVTVVLHRLKTATAGWNPPQAAIRDRDSAAGAVMRVALDDPAGSGRSDLAGRSAELIADAITNDPITYGMLIERISDSTAMDMWNMAAIQRLLWKLPALAAAAPEQARKLALAVWSFEVTSDGPEQIGSSQIMTFSTTKSAEVDQAKWEVGDQFPVWLEAVPAGAIDVFLELVAVHAPPLTTRSSATARHPAVRSSQSFLAGAGYGALQDMTKALAEYLKRTAATPLNGPDDSVPSRLLGQLASKLIHHEAWNVLLAAGTASPDKLGVLFLPLLEQGQLLDHAGTFAQAAALIRSISPVLDDQAHARLERCILAVRNYLNPDDDGQARIMIDSLLGCLTPTHIQEDGARQRLVDLKATGGPPEVPQPGLEDLPFRAFDIGIEVVQDPGSEEKQRLVDAINRVSADLQVINGNGEQRECSRAALRASFPILVNEFGQAYSAPLAEPDYDVEYESARSFLCAAADELAQDSLAAPDTDLGNQVLEVLLQALPPDGISTAKSSL